MTIPHFRHRLVRLAVLTLIGALSPAGCGTTGEGEPSGGSATADASTPDTSAPDTSAPDTGTPDTGTPDSSAQDTGAGDTGSDKGDISDVADATAPDDVLSTSDAADPSDTASTGNGGDTGDGAGVDAVADTGCGPAPKLWDLTLGHAAGSPLAVAPMGDGGAALTSSGAGTATVWRLSSTGNVAWKHDFAPATGASAHDVAPRPGGGVVICGERGTPKGPQGWLAALDAKGTVLWQHVVQYSEPWNGGVAVSDGPLVALTVLAGAPVGVGTHLSPSGSGKVQSSLTWFDASGKVTAQDPIYLGGGTTAAAIDTWEQGGVVVAGVGTGKSTEGDVFVTTWVAPGKAGGTHGIVEVFPTQGAETVVGVESLGAGRVAVAGQRVLSGKTALLLMIFDGTGKTVTWAPKSWAIQGETAATGLAQNGLGDLLVSAVANPSGKLGSSGTSGWILGRGTGGDALWQRAVGVDTAIDTVADVAVLPGGSLALVGTKGGVLRALRTTAWGHPSCTVAGKCTTQALSTCDDGNPCTAALCETSSGCQAPAQANGMPCPAGTCGSGVCGP